MTRNNLTFSDDRAFIIAELSANHQKDLKKAVQSLRAAKEAGVDAVKIQTYTPDTMTIDVDNEYFQIQHPEWGGQTLYSLYEKAYTPWDWYEALKKEADKQDVILFSTAFDKSAVDFLEDMNCPIHKISSFEMVDIPLIEYAAKTKKPLIISTGMASLEEVQEAVNAARKAGAGDITLLKCVSSYPARPENMNLRSIQTLKETFNCRVGLSDHTLGIAASIAAVSLGATVIEKHFTLTRAMKTPDSFFSLEPQEWKEMVDNIRIVEKALGTSIFGSTEDEGASKVFRRSLFAVKDVTEGELITKENVRSIRPGYGLAPKYYNEILGKKAGEFIKKGTPLERSMFK